LGYEICIIRSMTLLEIISKADQPYYITEEEYKNLSANQKITFLNSIANYLTLDSENYENKYLLEEQIEIIIRESLFLQASLN